MAGVSFRLEGADEALQKLGAAAARLEHPMPLHDLIGAMLTTSTQQRFEAERDPDGNPWPPSIRALTTGGKTLTDSALLRNSMTHEATDTGVAVGTNALYAAIHQFGGTIRPKTASKLVFEVAGQTVFVDQVTIPRRAFLGLDEADKKEIIEIAEDYVMAPLGGSNAG